MTIARSSILSPRLVLAMGVALLALAACARDGQDWKTAQGADTQEAYDAFVAQHPDSEFAPQARQRTVQLVEERDWAAATQTDTPEAYQKFVAQHPDGKWTQEARIRVENFNVMAADAPEAPAATPAAPDPAPAAAAPKPAAPQVARPIRTAPPAQAVAASADKAATVVQVPVPVAKPATRSAPAAAAAAVGTPAAAPTAAPTAATATATATATGSASVPGYRVQLGAFSSFDKAEAEWTRARDKVAALQALEPRITPAETRAGRLFRLQAGVADADAAKALCEKMKAASQPCLVVPPK